LILDVRLINKDQFDVCGESCSTGFSIMMSELGAVPITVETLLYRNLSKVSLLASYGGEPYFESNYEGIQPTALRELFPRVITQLTEQLGTIKERIYNAMTKVTQKEDAKTLLKNLQLRKGLNSKFHTLMFQEIENNPTGNRWDFVNRMAILAKDFDSVSRVRIEKVAGELLDLTFDKI
jgi:hypothetical protein